MYMKYIGENILLWKVFLLMNLHVEAKLCGSNPYYIDRYDLWGFIREINSGISPELLLLNYKCIIGYITCCVTVNTHTIVK